MVKEVAIYRKKKIIKPLGLEEGGGGGGLNREEDEFWANITFLFQYVSSQLT